MSVDERRGVFAEMPALWRHPEALASADLGTADPVAVPHPPVRVGTVGAVVARTLA